MEAKPNARRLLVIDDDILVLQILEDLFRSKGFRVASANDAELAVQLIREEHFDLVLTDLGMPGVDGWTIARQVKDKNPQTPVILLTGSGARHDETDLFEYAVDLVLGKPCSAKRLLRAIDMLLHFEGGPYRERRKHKRFPAAEGAFLAFIDPRKAGFIRIGEIIDIGRGGLSLRYMASGEQLIVSSYVEIFKYENPNFRLSPCRIIYDIEVRDEGRSSSNDIERRCGIQFVDFAEHKLSLVEFLIKDIT